MDQTPLSEERIPSAYSISFVLFFIGVLLFIGLVQRHWELSLMAILVLSVFAGSNGWSRISGRALTCGIEVEKRRLFPDESLSITVWVQNAKPLPVWVHIRLPIEQSAAAFTAREAFEGRCNLLWYQRTQFSRQLGVLRRGVHTLGPSYVTSADPFGFFPRHRRGPAVEIIVYPRLIPLRPIDLPRRSMFGVPGTRSPVQDPVYILGTRDYQAGRPARIIHWKASARHNRLQEKIFDPSEQEKLLLVLDAAGFAAHAAVEPFEKAIETIASVGSAMERRANAFGFATNAETVGGRSPVLTVAGHRRQLPDLLELLARIKMAVCRDLNAVLTKSISLSWGASALVFVYQIDQAARALAGYLSARQIPSRFVVCQAGHFADIATAADMPHTGLEKIILPDGDRQ